MKVQDLMIGDWVYGLYPNGKRYANPFRISAVDIYPENKSPRIVTYGGYGFQLEHLEPIPLTTEILEKNGFRNNRDKWMQLGNFDNPPLLMWHLKDESKFGHPETQLEIHWGTKFTHISFNCTEVHQLQHALRLCGIDKEIEL